MDLKRMPNDEKLSLCKWYFNAGFLLLPFVWAVNAVWFFEAAFRTPPFEQQKQIKKYVLLSACGALVWLIAAIVWITMYQTHRASWGELGDALSFVIPLGRP